MSQKQIEAKVLKKIAPNKEESIEVKKVAARFIKTLQKEVKGATVILGGSVAKDTFFKAKTDIDVFVQFDYEKYKEKSSKLSDLLAAAIKKAFPKQKIERVHGSRDYFQIQKGKFTFEIVPILEILKSMAAVNITDISPLHTVWVNKHPSKIKNQIRLTKQFTKAQGAYGAESYISGFSGYVLEILTIYYGSFQKLLEAAERWKEKQVVDVEEYHQGKDIFMEIDIAKLNSPIIVVDPVDKYRNTAAAMNKEKWKLFKTAAKKYLKSPNTSFFENQEISLEAAKKIAKNKKRNLLYLEIQAPSGKRDVVGCKLLKVFEHLKTKLSGFGVRECDWEWDPGSIMKLYVTTAKKRLPKESIKKGPPVKMKEAANNFKEKNAKHKIFEENGALFAKVEIKTRDLESVSTKILKAKYVSEKIIAVKKKEVFLI